jgi:predicted ArsR family transcriptional regulator
VQCYALFMHYLCIIVTYDAQIMVVCELEHALIVHK